MKNRIGIRREGLDKRSEMRVAVSPVEAGTIVGLGHTLSVQPGHHPQTGENKRAFGDSAYQARSAIIQEDLAGTDVIFGLKEIKNDQVLPGKTYLFFSHTHKGQEKNRSMLRTLVERKCTVIDYELITDDAGARLLKAFTFFAGYGGMVDSLWSFGRRMKLQGIEHPFCRIPQSIEKGDLDWFRSLLRGEVAAAIKEQGTPASMPPLITCILGRGKTSAGAQAIYDLLPVEEIRIDDLKRVFAEGSRHKVYKLVLEVYDMYRLAPDASLDAATYAGFSEAEKFQHYIAHPEMYESHLDGVLPYVSMLMNCILWSPKYPRVLPNALMAQIAEAHDTLKVIGDITCDPNGAIEFSQETWVDDPVYTYWPATQKIQDGFAAGGVQVMAVTNLPCAFSADASKQFAAELAPLLPGIIGANYQGSFNDAGLPGPIARATTVWRGAFTPDYEYMQAYLE